MPHFVIAGAGIAGLASALALARDGNTVDIAERRAALGDLGAGLQLAPNATRILDHLGLLASVERVATELRAVRIRRGRDGTDVARVPLGPAARARYGAPSLVVHRADLHGILAEAAMSHQGVRLLLGTTVTAIDGASGTAALTGMHDAHALSADGVIAADGVWGKQRRGPGPIYSGKSAWRALVPLAISDPVLAEPVTTLWQGERAHVVHYPLRGGSVLNLVVIVDEALGRAGDGLDPWAVPGDPDVLRRRLENWHPDLKAIVRDAPTWRKWPLFEGRPGRPWSEGRSTVVGDAAHPMLPFLAQGASQAFEDAAALAGSIAGRPNDIPAAFKNYEARRTGQARRVQDASRRQGRVYHLAGPAAAARDTVLGLLGPRRLLARMDWLYGTPRS